MGAVASNLGLPATFVAPDGRKLQVSPWTFEMQGLFEQYLEDKAFEVIERRKHKLTPEEYEQEKRIAMKDITLGTYSFGTEECARALATPRHVMYAFWLCVSFHHRDVLREEVQRWGQTHYADMVRAMNVANTDPNSKGETTETTSSPISQA